MTQDTAFWDRIAERYAARKIGDEAAYEATLERVRHWLRDDMDVLELGSGTGTTAVRLAGSAGSILGTDLSAEMLRIARGKAEAAGLENLHFEQVGALEAGSGRQFDAVMAFSLLHLLDDLPGVLGHVRGLLPEGGLLITKTPCLGRKLWLWPLIWGAQRLGKAPASFRYMTPAGVQRAISAAGFEVLETGDYPKSLPNHFVVARAI